MTKPRILGNHSRQLVREVIREAQQARTILEHAKTEFRRGNHLAALAMVAEAQTLTVSIENNALRAERGS